MIEDSHLDHPQFFSLSALKSLRAFVARGWKLSAIIVVSTISGLDSTFHDVL
jgi:hypothetical protein